MQGIRLISPRGVINFTLAQPPNAYIFESLYGQGIPTRQANETQGMAQIGSTYHSDTIMPRDLEFGCYVFGRKREEMYDARVYLNAITATRDNRLRIEYENDAGAWYCFGTVTVADYSPRIEAKAGHFQPIRLSVHCADPYWRIVQEPQKSLLTYQGGMFQMPFALIPPGIQLGARGYISEIYNAGTEDTPIEIWVKGPAQRPSITNETTGESIQLNIDLAPHQILYINTKPREKQLQIIDTLSGVVASGYGAGTGSGSDSSKGGAAPGGGGGYRMGEDAYGSGSAGNAYGGGMILIVAGGSLTIGTTGKITANGGDGGRGGSSSRYNQGAGSGGGGGGGIVAMLTSAPVKLFGSITVNGGISPPPIYTAQGGGAGQGGSIGTIYTAKLNSDGTISPW